MKARRDSAPASGSSRAAQLGTAWLMSSTVLVGGLNYLYTLCLVWWLAAGSYAVAASASALLLICGTVATASAPWVLAQEVANGRDDPERRRSAVSFCLSANLVQGVVGALVAVLVASRYAGWPVLAVVAASVVLIFAEATTIGYLQGYERFRLIAVLRLTEVVVKIGGGLILVGLGAGAGGALAGYALGAGVVSCVGLVVMAPDIRARFSAVLDRGLWSRARGVLLIQAGVAILASADVVVGSLLIPHSHRLATYQVSLVIARIPAILAGAISIAVFSRLAVHRDVEESAGQLRATFGLFIRTVAPIVVIAATLPPSLIAHIFPATYHGIDVLLPWTALAGGMIGAANLLTTPFQAQSRFRRVLKLLGVGLILHLIALIVGIEADGTTGLAIGSVVGATVVAALLLRETRSVWAGSCRGLVRSGLLSLLTAAPLVLFRGDLMLWAGWVTLWVVPWIIWSVYGSTSAGAASPAPDQGPALPHLALDEPRGLIVDHETGVELGQSGPPAEVGGSRQPGGWDQLSQRIGNVGPSPGPLVAEAVCRAHSRGRRPRVLVIGNIGNGNVGDEAVFAGLLVDLDKVSDVTVLTHDPAGVCARHRVRASKMVSLRAVQDLLQTDVIAVGGGGLFGAGLPPLVRLLPFVLCVARLALGKRIVFQAIGAYPGTPQPTLGALRLAGRIADAVLVRDEASLAVFRGGFAGRGVQPILVGDPAIFLPPATPAEARATLRCGGVASSHPPLVISVKPTPNEHITEQMIASLGEAAQWWCDHRLSDVVILPMSDIGDYGLGPSAADAVLGRRLADTLREPGRVKILPCDLPPALAKAVIGEAAAVIAVRLHASIFGWSMGVPLLTLPFEEKTVSWIRHIDGTAISLDQITSESVIAWLEDVAAEPTVEVYGLAKALDGLSGEGPENATVQQGQQADLAPSKDVLVLTSGSEPAPPPAPAAPWSRPRVLILGDSWIYGLGVKREQAFGQLAADALDAEEVLNLSGVSKTASDMVAEAEQIRDFRPTLAILFCGGTESLVHPGPVVRSVIDRWGPRSWRGLTGLEPRPYLASHGRRRLQQRLSSAAKTAVKRWTIAVTGGRRRTPLLECRESFHALIELLEGVGCPMAFVSMIEIDERLFPGTGAAINATEIELRDALHGRSDAVLVDVRHALRYWDDFLKDNLHLNIEGHQRVASLVVGASRELLATVETEREVTAEAVPDPLGAQAQVVLS